MNKVAKAGLILLVLSFALALIILVLHYGNQNLLAEYEEAEWTWFPKNSPSEGVLETGRLLVFSILILIAISGLSFLIGVPLFVAGLVKGKKERRTIENVRSSDC